MVFLEFDQLYGVPSSSNNNNNLLRKNIIRWKDIIILSTLRLHSMNCLVVRMPLIKICNVIVEADRWTLLRGKIATNGVLPSTLLSFWIFVYHCPVVELQNQEFNPPSPPPPPIYLLTSCKRVKSKTIYIYCIPRKYS